MTQMVLFPELVGPEPRPVTCSLRWIEAVWGYMQWFRKRKMPIYASLRRIAKTLGCSIRTVQYAIKQLHREGRILSVKRRGYEKRRTNHYILPEDVQNEHPAEPVCTSVCTTDEPDPLYEENKTENKQSGLGRKRIGSDDIRDELIKALRAAGVKCEPEVWMPSVKLSDGTVLWMRADVGVLSNGRPVFLVECKNYRDPHPGGLRWELTMQFKKYSSTGLPFLLCASRSEIPGCVQAVLDSVWERIPEAPPATPAPSPSVSQTQEDRAFEEYIGLFRSAGGAFNDLDLRKAHKLWNGMPIEERICAVRHATETFPETEPRFIKLPQNHLLDKPWTRVKMERTLPLVAREDPAKKSYRESFMEWLKS